MLCLGWCVVVCGWLLRNFLLTGFVFFHTLPGNHFLSYVALPIDMYTNGCSSKMSFEKIFGKELPMLFKEAEREKGKSLQEIEKCVLAERLALTYMIKRPVLALKNALYNMIKTCVSLYSSHILALCDYYPSWTCEHKVTIWHMVKRYLFPPIKNSWLKMVIWFEIIFICFIFLGFIGGLIYSLFDLNLFRVVLQCMPFLCLMIFLTFASGIARLRLPVEPFFIIVACYFWMHCLRRACRAWREDGFLHKAS